MTRVATPANESVLVHVARNGTAAHVEKLVRKYHWTQRRDAAKLAQVQHEQRHVTYFYDEIGELILNARLPREIGAVVRKAIEAAVEALREPAENVSAETATSAAAAAGARRADALRHIAETFLEHRGEETGAGSSADRYQVVVHIDQAILAESAAAADDEPHCCELEDGPALALDTARRLSCDATIVGLVEGADGEPLNIGRKARSIPPAIARALRARDGGCRFPGCDRTRFCEGHHIKHWANGGETKLGNLITLCGFHHGLVHEGGYGTTVRRAVRFHAAQRAARRGERFPMFPARRTKITAETGRCQWRGETMDYSQAIEAMQVLEHKAAVDMAVT